MLFISCGIDDDQPSSIDPLNLEVFFEPNTIDLLNNGSSVEMILTHDTDVTLVEDVNIRIDVLNVNPDDVIFSNSVIFVAGVNNREVRRVEWIGDMPNVNFEIEFGFTVQTAGIQDIIVPESMQLEVVVQ